MHFVSNAAFGMTMSGACAGCAGLATGTFLSGRVREGGIRVSGTRCSRICGVFSTFSIGYSATARPTLPKPDAASESSLRISWFAALFAVWNASVLEFAS